MLDNLFLLRHKTNFQPLIFYDHCFLFTVFLPIRKIFHVTRDFHSVSFEYQMIISVQLKEFPHTCILKLEISSYPHFALGTDLLRIKDGLDIVGVHVPCRKPRVSSAATAALHQLQSVGVRYNRLCSGPTAGSCFILHGSSCVVGERLT